jgi:hypothetical protein
LKFDVCARVLFGEINEKGNKEGGARVNKKEVRGFLTKLPSPSSRTEQRREGLGAAGSAGVGDCRRSRSRQRPGLGAKGRGDRGGSIPTLTLGRGGTRERLPGRWRTAGSGGWGGSGSGVSGGEEAWGGFYRQLKAVRAEKYRQWGSPAKAVLGRVLGGRPDSRP